MASVTVDSFEALERRWLAEAEAHEAAAEEHASGDAIEGDMHREAARVYRRCAEDLVAFLHRSERPAS